MKIRANFNERVVVHSEQLDWLSSPMKGVERRPLDRVGNEVARATSIVRYAPGSHFSEHTHTGGEEFVVLEGVFQDEHGDFPVGSYIRNPPTSSHTPCSIEGCVIFVKLWQFQPQDRTHVNQNIDAPAKHTLPSHSGVSQLTLYQDEHEQVYIQEWKPDYTAHLTIAGGTELLVLSGQLQVGDDTLVKNSWMRLPIGMALDARAGHSGAKIWLKTGHLKDVALQIQRVSQA